MKRFVLLGVLAAMSGCSGTVTPQSDGGTAQDVVAMSDAPTLSNCDRRTVVCRSLPPMCPSRDGNAVPEVTADGVCWTGRCIQDPRQCAPIRCDPATTSPQCPGAWHCDQATALCVPTACPTC